MPLAPIEIAVAKGAGTVTSRYRAPPRSDLEWCDVWAGVPLTLSPCPPKLNGRSITYPYSGSAYSNIASYSLAARSQLPAASRVVLFARPTVTSVDAITVLDAVDPALCTVDIALTAGDSIAATWREVPRDQVLFAL